jgi:hypothetical protein
LLLRCCRSVLLSYGSVSYPHRSPWSSYLLSCYSIVWWRGLLYCYCSPWILYWLSWDGWDQFSLSLSCVALGENLVRTWLEFAWFCVFCAMVDGRGFRRKPRSDLSLLCLIFVVWWPGVAWCRAFYCYCDGVVFRSLWWLYCLCLW